MEREFLIYVTTNLNNNKIYVGQTHYKNKDYLGSGVIIKQAILKNGIENFKKEYIDTAKNQTELDEKEKFWIKKLNAQDKSKGYNIADGGWNNFTMNDEIKKKISDTLSGRKLTKEHIEKIRNANKGRIVSEKQRNQISRTLKRKYKEDSSPWFNHKPMSNETKKKISIAHKGKKLSEEHKKKISDSGKARNFKWSSEQIKQISDSNRNKHQKTSWYIDILNKETGETFTLNNKMQAVRFLNISKHLVKKDFETDLFLIKKVYR